jgi:O-antigen/teichoic acid export membrane protein
VSTTRPGRQRIVADIAVQLVARVLNLVLGIFVTLILVRRLGTHGFGAWSAIFAVGQIAGGIGELGLNEIAVSRAAREPERERDWLGALLGLRFLIAIPMTAGSIVAILLVTSTGDARLAGVIVSCALLLGVPSTVGVIFQLRVRNDVSMVLLTFNSVLWGVAVGLVALLKGGLVDFSLVFVASTAVTAALTVVFALRMGSVQVRGARALWPLLLRVGVPAGIGGIMVTFYVKLDQILVFDIAGSHQAGLYGAAYRLLEQVQFIPAAVMTTLFPLIAAAHSSGDERLRRMLQSAAEYLAMLSLPIVAFTIVAARPIVTLLFSSEFAGAARALPMLAGAFVSISFGYLVGNMVIVLELQRRFIVFATAGLALNAALNVVLIPKYGFVAAAWITVATEFTVMTLSMRIVLRALAMRPRFLRVLRTLLAASLMGLATWLADLAGMPLSVLVAVAALTYVPALFALRIVTVGELRGVIARDPRALDD